ncbi:PREDICTED: elongation of very long chain fatty acids protein AAEL008004-like [Nicrophorus vespilloides]|uniref:Elongation of very long chain fatty acids protein n=1 Tax=Nicrophorus vespilloides TaxID=110193 RepID=A0ABM1MRI2_NICVS|nr:PREDICTED: elongation of very long chain fatty acids protein AAEL008004-like [Nicrophorus vespilloides]
MDATIEDVMKIVDTFQQQENFTYNEMAGLVRMAIDTYGNILDRISDPRTTDWPLMNSPIPTIVMVLAYLYTVIFLGPRLMANRKPFKLREVLVLYNGGQVLFSLYMLYEHLMSGWFFDYSYKCQPVDYSNSEKGMRMATLCWWYYISKLSEFADTVFFVMRKKDSQITLLHLYHHSLTPLETWVLVKFVAGGHGTFSNLINNLVHVIMYFYYMVSAMGPDYQKYLWWKKHLTTIQLTQFFFVFIHSAQILFVDCGYPMFLGALLLLHSAIFFGLFSHFYYQTYNRNKAIKKD